MDPISDKGPKLGHPIYRIPNPKVDSLGPSDFWP